MGKYCIATRYTFEESRQRDKGFIILLQSNAWKQTFPIFTTNFILVLYGFRVKIFNDLLYIYMNSDLQNQKAKLELPPETIKKLILLFTEAVYDSNVPFTQMTQLKWAPEIPFQTPA